jgi:Zn-finger in ubiquitin-hydrolases and other protein
MDIDLSEAVDYSVPPSGPGCAGCESASPPGWWFHLRRCALCGHVGCCDSSPAQHARGHFRSSGHRLIASYEPGEGWFYDFVTDQAFEGPPLAAPTAHPVDQPTPGPAGRVPADWQASLHR